MNSPPLVSIGLFVHNAETLLESAIESFQNQTLKGFELIISDDGSTDRTQEICRRRAAEDARIRYYRNERNMGSDWNAGRVYSLAAGKYFKWAAHDDMIQPDYLRLCVDALEADRSLVLAHSFTRVIDPQGQFIENYDERLRTNSPDPLLRLKDLLLVPHRCYPIFGLIRMDALRRLPPQRSYAHSNRVLLMRLALQGRYYEVPEFLFLSTRQAARSTWATSTAAQAKSSRWRIAPSAKAEWDPTRSQTIRFPEWNVLRQYLLSVGSSPLSLVDRLRSYALLARWMLKHRAGMAQDLVRAVEQLLFNIRNRRTIASSADIADASTEVLSKTFYLELNTSGGESL